jgi:hypothetical protein
MSRQTNFKNIFIVLGVLVALLILLKLNDKKQGDRSFKAYVVAVDTSKVNEMSIIPKGNRQKLTIKKEEATWMLDYNNTSVQANNEIIHSLLSQVSSLKTKSVAATSKEKWLDYEVSDSAGTRITLSDGKKELADFIIGKFSYSQPQGQNPYMQQGQIQMTSYLRLYDEDEVYAVDGYLSMLFNREVNSFRENTIISGDPKDWQKLVFNYPADSSFTLVNQNGKWMVDGVLADSAVCAQYLSTISRLSSSTFEDQALIEPVNSQPELLMRIEGETFKAVEIKAYRNNANEWVCISSQNKGNILNINNLTETLFVNRNQFLTP